jgi:hypothetical protein
MDTSTFFSIGLIIAIFLIVEAFTLQKNEGRFTPLVIITTTCEFIWILVCVYALFAINLPAWSILIPAAFIAYSIVASWHFRDIGKDIETMDDIKELQVPFGFTKISLFAGIALLLLNGAALILL